MNIDDLPSKLRRLATVYIKLYPLQKGSKDLNYAFRWSNTKEGHQFWLNIYNGNLRKRKRSPIRLITYKINHGNRNKNPR